MRHHMATLYADKTKTSSYTLRAYMFIYVLIPIRRDYVANPEHIRAPAPNKI